MDARFSFGPRFFFARGSFALSGWLAVVAVLTIGFVSSTVSAAGFRTRNFLVQADTGQMAQAVAQAAENYRSQLAQYWLGRTLPPWPTPCPIRVIAGPHLAAQGVTTYNRAPVRDFQMEVVGTPERILDSVLPHEVTHTILATHFGRPLPRWADEGICTTVEHESERSKHEAKLREFLHTRRGIAMNRLFLLTEYPSDLLPMYSQGYSVCRFLIEQDSPTKFIQFLEDYMQSPSWTANVRKHYRYESLAELQQHWLAWVREGSSSVERFAKISPASDRVKQAAYADVERQNDPPPVDSVAQSNNDRPRDWRPSQLPAAAATLPAPPSSLASRANSGSGVAASTSPATALQTIASDGWYQRQRDQAANQDGSVNVAGSAPPSSPRLASRGDLHSENTGSVAAGEAKSNPRFPAITPLMPPSVRNHGRYSVSQPQPESGARGSFRKIPILDWPDGSPRYR